MFIGYTLYYKVYFVKRRFPYQNKRGQGPWAAAEFARHSLSFSALETLRDKLPQRALRG